MINLRVPVIEVQDGPDLFRVPKYLLDLALAFNVTADLEDKFEVAVEANSKTITKLKSYPDVEVI